jgi:DNA-binding transcriptional ArsR family regulator
MGRRRKKNPSPDPDWVRAISHPLRVAILDILNEQEASPNGMKDILREPVQKVSYHTKVLVECGYIEPTRTTQRRGATEHYYRALPESSFGTEMLRQVPRSLKGNVALASFKSFVAKLVVALKAGVIGDGDDSMLNSMTLAFDQTGRTAAAGVMQATLTQLKEIDEQSRKRAAEHDEPLTPYVSGLALFAAVSTASSDHGDS